MRKTNYSKELIDDAIYLHNNIDSITNDIVHARLNNDEEANKKAISRMETAMCGTQQFLKCIIDRRENIVDLSEIWHEISVEPEYDDKRLVFECKDGFISYCSTKSQAVKCWGIWERVSLGATVRWAYVEDLLPKGGE